MPLTLAVQAQTPIYLSKAALYPTSSCGIHDGNQSVYTASEDQRADQLYLHMLGQQDTRSPSC